MSEEKWTVKFVIFRKKGDQPARYDSYVLEVDPEEYVIDGVERIWAFHDRSLIFAPVSYTHLTLPTIYSV